MNIRHYLPKFIAITAIAVLAATNSCFGTVLSVTQRYQEQNQWCWNACCQMILEFNGNSYSQTAIADWAVQGRNVPNFMYNSSDSSRHGMDEVLTHFGSIATTGSGSAMSLSTLTSEISAGRPVAVGWGWDSGGGHVVIARGTDGNYVYLNDPWHANGQSVQTYNWVCQAGGGGTWDSTLKLDSSGNEYYTYYQQYMGYASYYLDRYYSTGSSSDLYYAYYYYAYAGGYYYLSYGQTSAAIRHYYYYQSTANQVLADYWYAAYAYTGVYQYAGNCLYYYAYTYYYYYMYTGNSSYANYYYNYYMSWANWYWSH